MAKAEPQKPAPAAAKSKAKKKGRLGALVVLLIVVFATPFILPTIFLVAVAMIPTYVTLITDTDPQKSGTISVGALNIAGVTPFVLDLFSKGQDMTNAVHILVDPNSWLVILGVSAVGHLILYAVPQAIATLSLAQADSRVKNLRKNLDTLKETWGPEVATVKPVDMINQE